MYADFSDHLFKRVVQKSILFSYLFFHEIKTEQKR